MLSLVDQQIQHILAPNGAAEVLTQYEVAHWLVGQVKLTTYSDDEIQKISLCVFYVCTFIHGQFERELPVQQQFFVYFIT